MPCYYDKDEFDDLAEDFNKMAASLKESQEEINRQEERRRQFMADASHEMRTPLTTINGLLEGLQYNAIPENQKENAIKLMQNETARLIRLVNENLDLETIVRISDTGIGMTEEQILNIWDRYYKVDPSRKNTKYGESGLGLPIVQQLVRLHKGKINVESEPGKGTTFIISFPDVEITEN